MNYQELNDYELLSYVSEGNEDASEILFKKYRPFIISTAKKYYQRCKNNGLEINDLIQEAMIGFNYAINSFKEQKDVLFYTYAKTCVENRLSSTVIGSMRLKNRILNESISLENTNDDYDLNEIIGDDSVDPQKLVLDFETEKGIIEMVKKDLTDLEDQVFELKLNGFNYKEIANILQIDSKKVDNTLQRIKIKFKKKLEKDNL